MVKYISWLAAFFWVFMALPGIAQTRAVDPVDLTLTVTLETLPETPFRQEMILLTIHGVYKRHITREKLLQPSLEGFNWMQLGEDHWYESMLDGRPVKNMRRRMAIFPDGAGRLRIGRFKHQLTLLDEDNKWFEHMIEAAPIEIDVLPEPGGADWWFPVRGLRVTDNWSNAPDQLVPGAGVLRVVRISALGASPDMIPPMPELKSPSALIFAHPEKRLVDLTSNGPQAIAFWRWTVTPTNGHAAILEPIEFSYFDTVERQTRNVVISAQRVAFGDAIRPPPAADVAPPAQKQMRPALLGAIGFFAFVAGTVLFARGRVLSVVPLMSWARRHYLLWQFSQAARCGDAAGLRRLARALDEHYAPSSERMALLAELDNALFGRAQTAWDMAAFCTRFRRSLSAPLAAEPTQDQSDSTHPRPAMQ